MTPAKAKLKRRNNRHAILRAWPQGEWCPAAVGVVPGYPRSRAIFDAQCERNRANIAKAKAAGTLTRHGVPNGWAGRKQEVAEHFRNSKTAAERLEKKLEEERVWVPDCREARLAMTVALEIAVNLAYRPSVRLSAMRLILLYTQAHPSGRISQAEQTSALGFLERLAASVLEE